MKTVTALAADYYRDNFLHLLNFVAEHYWHLLPDAERTFYRRFTQLPPLSQQLYIRLLSRRGSYFRLSKLHYAEIGNLLEAAAPLKTCALLRLDPAIDFDQLLTLYTKAELLGALRSLNLSPCGQQPRAALVAQLVSCDEPTQHALSHHLRRPETILQPLDTELFTCFQLCFFGNLRQDLTDYVLRDLGTHRYEDYVFDSEHAPFHSQQQLQQHLHYYALMDTLTDQMRQDSSALITLWRALPVPEATDLTLQRRVQRSTNMLARQLERLGANDAALQLYRSNTRPPARERRARLLLKGGDIDACLTLCRDISATARNEEERLFAEEFGARQARRHGRDWPAPTRYDPPQEYLELSPSNCTVERAAAQHYAALGECHYVENSLINGMLGLFIWDIVFAAVRGAFFNPFQHAPADFNEHSFASTRRQLLTARFAELNDPTAMRRRILSNWDAKFGRLNPLVHWERLSAELLERALERIPANHWHCLFHRLLDDLQHHRSGLPDLILFPHEGHYRLIEVKAQGDRLQKNQQRWMRFFAHHDIPHQVSHITWIAT